MRQLLSIIVLIAIFGIGFTSCKEKTRRVKKKVAKVAVVIQDTVVPEAVVYKAAEEPVVEVDPNKYFLIAASFESRENAETMVSKLVELGYQSRMFETEDNLFRVSYMSFSNKAKALRALKEERAKDDSQEVWLHIPKNVE